MKSRSLLLLSIWLLMGLISSRAETNSAATGSVAAPRPAWEKTPEGIRFNATATQEEFAKFCAANPDTTNLVLWETKNITDLTPLAGLKHLAYLKLWRLKPANGSERVDISIVAKLPKLATLDCYATAVIGEERLQGHPALKDISFYMSRIGSLDGMKGITTLEHLNLYGSQHTFRDYRPLTGSRLKTINVYMNPQATPENLAVLATMPSLEEFHGNLTKTITSIDFLKPAVNLRKVALWDNPVTSIEALRDKKNLQSLMLRGTKIQDIALVATMPELLEIDIRGTAVTDLSPLLACSRLSMVRLSDTIPSDQINALKARFPNLQLEIEKPRR